MPRPNLNQQQFREQKLPMELPPHWRDLPPEMQTREQFEQSSETWFHGTMGGPYHSIEEFRPQAGEIHVGTNTAALDRMQSVSGVVPPSTTESFNAAEAKFAGRGRMHAYQISGPMRNRPDTPMRDPDEIPGSGAELSGIKGAYYRNIHEDPGSISAMVSGPGFLRGHKDFVQQAQRTGKPFSPLAAAESEIMPSGRRLDEFEKDYLLTATSGLSSEERTDLRRTEAERNQGKLFSSRDLEDL